jgi:hypothetical protein
MKKIHTTISITILLAVFAFARTAHAQTLTQESITGKWALTGVITDGELMPLDSDATLIQYMLDDKLAKKRKKEGADATLNNKDSTSTLAVAKMLLVMRHSEAEFKSQGKFRFILALAFSQKTEILGTWQLDEAAQTIRITEKPNNQNEAPRTMKATLKGEQLFLQPEEEKADGYLLRKKA